MRSMVLSALLLISLVGIVHAEDSISIKTSGERHNFAISGHEVNIYGSHNIIEVNGSSEDFDVYGEGNKIVITGTVEDLDVYGPENRIEVRGHLVETDIRGDGNRVDCSTVDDVGFDGSNNVVIFSEGPDPRLKNGGQNNELRRIEP